MALNVPINLMSAAAPPPQQPVSNESASNDVSAVQPAAASSDTSSASTSNNSGMGSSQQQAQTSNFANSTKSRAPVPDKAEPKSVVTAQIETGEGPNTGALADARRAAEANQAAERTEALIERIAVAPEAPSILLETPEQENEKEVQEDTTPKQTSELDRFSPPDPLPTAPILKAADSYAAMSKER